VSLKRAYIDLHIAVVLLAGTAILGDLISLSASVLVWWRTLVASLGVGLFLLITGRLKMECFNRVDLFCYYLIFYGLD